MYKRILVPLDGSETARFGLRKAMTLAKQQKATLHLLHISSDGWLFVTGGVSDTEAEALRSRRSEFSL